MFQVWHNFVLALHKWQYIKRVTQISNGTKVTGTVIKGSNKRSNILKMSPEFCCGQHTNTFKLPSWSAGKEAQGKKRKSIHFRAVKMVWSNMVIRLWLHWQHSTLSKRNIPEQTMVDTLPGRRDNSQFQTPENDVKTDVGQFTCANSEFLIKHLTD